MALTLIIMTIHNNTDNTKIPLFGGIALSFWQAVTPLFDHNTFMLHDIVRTVVLAVLGVFASGISTLAWKYCLKYVKKHFKP